MSKLFFGPALQGRGASQGRIQDLKLGVAQMDWIWKQGGGWRRQRAFIGEKVPENGSFWDQLYRGVGLLAPLRGKWHTQTIHRWTTNIV